MKKIFIIGFLPVVLLFSGCNRVNELPPRNSGNQTKIILPEPVDLSVQEREYLESLQNEYKQSLKEK